MPLPGSPRTGPAQNMRFKRQLVTYRTNKTITITVKRYRSTALNIAIENITNTVPGCFNFNFKTDPYF
jgi:hypothetical protein